MKYLAAAILISTSPLAVAAPPPTFCVIKVNTVAADHATKIFGSSTTFNIQVPGMPSPIFGYAGEAFVIGSDYALHPYDAPFPQAELFNSPISWLDDPWHSRKLGIIAHPPLTILEMKTGETQFHIVYQDQSPVWELQPHIINLHYFSFINQDSRNHQIVFTSLDGRSSTIQNGQLIPWPDKTSLFNHNVAGALSIAYDQAAHAMFVDDGNFNLYAWTDSNSWYKVSSINSMFDRIIHLPGIGTAVLRAGKLVDVIVYDPSDTNDPYKRLVGERGRFSDFEWMHLSELFSQILRYNTDFPWFEAGHWQVLTANGYRDIPGGNTGLDPGINAMPKDVPVIQKSVIEGADKWYLYDGQKIVPVPGSETKIIGPNIYYRDLDGTEIYNLPSIGHVLVARDNGVYEITSDGKMRKRPQLAGGEEFYDWPEAGVALEKTGGGIFVIDKTLSRLNKVSLSIDHAEMSLTQPLLWGTFAPDHGLVGRIGTSDIGILVDTALAGPSGCPKGAP